MTDYTWPSAIVPASATWRMAANTAAFGARAAVRAGDRWACTLSLPVLERDDAAVLQAFLARLRGASHRVVLPNHAYSKRGSLTANALVAGGSQTGSTLVVDNVEVSLTNALRAGDWIAVAGRLYMVSADCSSTEAGVLSIPLTHPIATAPADNAAVTVIAPAARFIFTGSVSWLNEPGGFASVSPLEFLEDIP